VDPRKHWSGLRATLMKKTLFALIATFWVCSGGLVAAAQVSIASHRAIYDLSLVRSTTRAGIATADGRMAMELTGSACEGWSVNFRRVLRLLPNEGITKLLDTQITSWEAGDGLSMRVAQKEYVNEALQSDTKLSAEFPKRGEAGRGHMDLPTPEEFDLSPETIFPIEHQIRLMTAAEADGTRDVSHVFDGSSGTKVFKAITFIGKKREPNSTAPTTGKPEDRLAALPSWPVAISFFEDNPDEETGEELPSYQVSFTLYENGVAENLLMDYGDFAVKGTLSKLDFLKQPDCHS
jgi:EipB-like